MEVLGRGCRILGGGRRSFAEFVGTTVHVDRFVEACDLMMSARVFRFWFQECDVPSYCIC